jgi:hypothetical protein
MNELSRLDQDTRRQFAAALFDLFDAFRQVGVAPKLLRYCYAVATLLRCYCYAAATLVLRCCYAAAAAAAAAACPPTPTRWLAAPPPTRVARVGWLTLRPCHCPRPARLLAPLRATKVLRSHDLEDGTRTVIEPGVSALLRGVDLLDASHAEMALGMQEDFENGNNIAPGSALDGGGAGDDGEDEAGDAASAGNPFGSAPSAGRDLARSGSNSGTNRASRMMRGMSSKAPSFFRKGGASS